MFFSSALRREGDGQEDDEELEKEKKELPSKIDEMEKAMNKLAGEIKRFVLIQVEINVQLSYLELLERNGSAAPNFTN